MALLSSLSPIPALEAARGFVTSLAWPRLVSLARAAVKSQFGRMKIGSLTLVDSSGEVYEFGTKPAKVNGNGIGKSGLKPLPPSAELCVLDDAFWVRLLVYADMGFAESYMLGEVSCSDLTSFFKIFIVNRDELSNGTNFTSSLSCTIAGLARASNTLTISRHNVAAHYDISNDMFAAFLSPDMTYSCPIWAPTNRDLVADNESLEAAQARKLAHVIRAARLKPDDHVLEIGTGWGSFALAAAGGVGCRVTSLTLSAQQKALADARIADAGLADRVSVLLCDYRDAPPPDGRPGARYDKIVSVEMLEAVGRDYLVPYFAVVDRLLKRDGGIAVFQCITMPESRYEAYARADDFIRRYIFPGGHLPHVSQLVSAISAGSHGTLVVDSILDIGPHYAKTLRLWRDAFLDSFANEIAPALTDLWRGASASENGGDAKGDQKLEKDVELFRRKWEYYFTYCEAGFATKTLGDVIITVGREGALELMEGVPL